MNDKEYIIIDKRDNVAVALRALSEGEKIANFCLKSSIKCGHKFALCDINKGSPVIKYGKKIGLASRDIERGELVHSHNLASDIAVGEYKYCGGKEYSEICSDSYSILGYIRKNGEVGLRNYLYLIPTVGCVNGIVEKLKSYAESFIGNGVDAVVDCRHQFGCSQLGDDHKNTQKLLAGILKNPNAGGVLVVGLGCENNNISEFKKVLGAYDEERVAFLNCQSIENEIEEGKLILGALTAKMRADRKERAPVTGLVVGLKCGGSDGFSGITANPALGRLCDFFTSLGAKVIMTEVPEMFGAEESILARAKDEQIFEKSVSLINGFKEYYIAHNMPVCENPSPGNREGGITTLEEKSLGCTQKSGDSTVTDVISYGERVKKSGLSLLCAPGNDIVAATALAAAGANLILFTTGRGTPLGSVVPVIKVASNSALAQKKSNWIDFDCGIALEDKVDTLTEELKNKVFSVANGEKTQNEINKYFDFAVFKNGVTL